MRIFKQRGLSGAKLSSKQTRMPLNSHKTFSHLFNPLINNSKLRYTVPDDMEQAESSAAGAKRKATTDPADRPSKRPSGASRYTKTYSMPQERDELSDEMGGETLAGMGLSGRNGLDAAELFARPGNVWSVEMFNAVQT